MQTHFMRKAAASGDGSNLGTSVAAGAGGGAVVGALSSLLRSNPSLREALQSALVGGIGGAAIGGGIHAMGRTSSPAVTAPDSVSRTPSGESQGAMSLPLAAIAGMVPGLGPAIHGAVSAGPAQAAGSAAASILPAMAVTYPSFRRSMEAAAAGVKTPVSGRTRIVAALASILGATGAAHVGNKLRADPAGV